MTLVGCSKEDSPNGPGTLSVSAKSSFSSPTGKSLTAKTTNNDVVVTDFRMNLKEFELEFDLEDSGDDYEADDNEQWDDNGYYDFEDDIELAGPFELDLMAGQIGFLNVSLPMGNFEELEFKFDTPMLQAICSENPYLSKVRFKELLLSFGTILKMR